MTDSLAPERRPRDRRSPVETLLAGHAGDVPLSPPEAESPAFAAAPGTPAERLPAGRASGEAVTGEQATRSLPPVEDVALGMLLVAVAALRRAGGLGLGLAGSLASRTTSVLRAVSPGAATAQVDARLEQLAVRGQQFRAERSALLTASLTRAIMTAATSDAVREMTVAAVEEATDDVLAVVMPALLDAMTDEETEAALDDLMAGLLTRQLPAALERTIPTVLMRTATRPTQFMPFLGGVLPKG